MGGTRIQRSLDVLGQDVGDGWSLRREDLRGIVEIAVFTYSGGLRVSP
jgi:hypothetical protein